MAEILQERCNLHIKYPIDALVFIFVIFELNKGPSAPPGRIMCIPHRVHHHDKILLIHQLFIGTKLAVTCVAGVSVGAGRVWSTVTSAVHKKVEQTASRKRHTRKRIQVNRIKPSEYSVLQHSVSYVLNYILIMSVSVQSWKSSNNKITRDRQILT